jgi:hypothetical protein
MALKYADYLDRLLCSKGKENPGLLSSEWALLHMLCEKLDSDEHAAFELIAGQLADRRSSGPLIRAMKAIAHDHLEIKLYDLANLKIREKI